MSVLIRNDGTQFVTQAYRETLSMHKKTEFVQEIRLLAEQHGQYVQLFAQEKGQCHIVFSSDPGYLLGESIWHYFDKPDNLIYCEALPDSANVIIVAVSNGEIFIDAQVLASNLQNILLPLMTGEVKYRIVTSGNVPLRKAESFGTFRFPKALIESFETLDGPLFTRLPALKALQLQPLPLTLKKEHLNHRFSTSFIVIIVLVIALFSWWLLIPSEEATTLRPSRFHNEAMPYSEYIYALTTPAPDLELMELSKIISQLYFLPGWQAKHIVFKPYQYCINLSADGGEMGDLREWSKRNHYKFNLGEQGVELLFDSRIVARTSPKVVYPIEQTVSQLRDNLDQLLQKHAVKVGETRFRDGVRETNMTVYLSSISPDLLTLVSHQFSNMPVELISADVDLNSGLMSGTIHLTVWGK